MKRYDIYRNLHRGGYSVIDRRTGRVVQHTNRLVAKDAEFVVRVAGRERVRREKRKNVHAFVRCVSILPGYLERRGRLIRYDPYTMDAFQFENGVEAASLPFVELNSFGVFELLPDL